MKAKWPLVSVIITTYNQDKYIRKAIESVLVQKTNFDFQLIIGEDFSQDKTRDICIEYSKQYPNKIQLLLHDKNIGMLQNAIQSFRLAKGRYIAFCEGDDCWTNDNKLQMQCDLLENNSHFSGVHTKVSYIDSDGNTIGESDLMPVDSDSVSFDYLVQKNVIHTCSFMLRRSILDETVYSLMKETPIPDYTLFLATALRGNIYYFKAITAAYRRNIGITADWIFSETKSQHLAVYSLFENHYNIKKHKRAMYAAKQYHHYHSKLSQKRSKKALHLVRLLWYSLLTSLFPPECRVYKISLRDVVRIIYKNKPKLRNWLK